MEARSVISQAHYCCSTIASLQTGNSERTSHRHHWSTAYVAGLGLTGYSK